MLNAGQMREQVVITRRSTTQDGAGEPTTVWLHLATRRAEIERMTGREAFAAQQRFGRVPTIFHLRWLEDVGPDCRLMCGTALYDIVSAIDPDGQKAELTLTCLELVGEVA